MALTNQPADLPQQNRPYLNVLLLDGGGVRGISSLLVLERLMNEINKAYHALSGDPDKVLHPHHVFGFVAGTSTGGLIALMLGKLGMTVEECIEQYRSMSKIIFGKKQIRGRVSAGLWQSRYSGQRLRKCVEDLLVQRGHNRDLSMVRETGKDVIACAVVCREHESQSKYASLKDPAVCICSLKCKTMFQCMFADAARATSAAPTYFTRARIGERCLVDGGLQYNNSSLAIHAHYTQGVRIKSSQPVMPPAESAVASDHVPLDFSRVRYVNLGTGTKPTNYTVRRRERVQVFVPGVIRMAFSMSRMLKDIAVNSERDAEYMALIAHHSEKIEFTRFSANNGVCWIKLDSHLEIPRIETLTNNYLDLPEIQESLCRLGKVIAQEFWQGRPTATTTVAPPTVSYSQASSVQRHMVSQKPRAADVGTPPTPVIPQLQASHVQLSIVSTEPQAASISPPAAPGDIALRPMPPLASNDSLSKSERTTPFTSTLDEPLNFGRDEHLLTDGARLHPSSSHDTFESVSRGDTSPERNGGGPTHLVQGKTQVKPQHELVQDEISSLPRSLHLMSSASLND